VGKAVCGYDIKIFNEEGNEVQANQQGYVVKLHYLQERCLWKDNTRFRTGYLEQFPGYYFSGDGGYKDEDDYIYITGRVDDVINVAGHRLSTAEMEEVVASHQSVAECAIGINDLRGQIPLALVVTKIHDEIEHFQLEHEIIHMIRQQIGAVASLRNVVLDCQNPFGKILRKLMRSIADGEQFQTRRQ
jgi:propionyl-CoA synthetase